MKHFMKYLVFPPVSIFHLFLRIRIIFGTVSMELIYYLQNIDSFPTKNKERVENWIRHIFYTHFVKYFKKINYFSSDWKKKKILTVEVNC